MNRKLIVKVISFCFPSLRKCFERASWKRKYKIESAFLEKGNEK